MAKEIARFQLTSGSNNLERWLIDDDANLIYDNTDSTKYVNISSRNYYNSAFFNFPTSLYGYLFSSGFLLCDKATKVYKQRSTDGGTTWSDYSQTSSMVSTYGTVYTLSNPDTNIGGTYVINLNCNDAQCISSIATIFTVVSEYNAYVSTIYEPPYNWQPVQSISGKLGTFTLSQIGTINSGNPVSNATIDDIAEIESTTELSTLAEGCDVETPIIYSDRFNYISIKDNGDDTCNLKFYYRGSPIYSLMEISQNAYLSMLIDSENEVLKPSIIYSTDATHYSYNQETPTDDEMLALYRWLTANAQLEEFEAYRYHDENGVEIVLEDKGNSELQFYEEVTVSKIS